VTQQAYVDWAFWPLGIVGQDGILRPIGNRPLARHAAFCNRDVPAMHRLSLVWTLKLRTKPARVCWLTGYSAGAPTC